MIKPLKKIFHEAENMHYENLSRKILNNNKQFPAIKFGTMETKKFKNKTISVIGYNGA